MSNTMKPKVRYVFSGLPARFSQFKKTPWFMYVGFMLDVENNEWMESFIHNYKNSNLLRHNHEEVMYWFCEKIHQYYNSDIFYDSDMLPYRLKHICDVHTAQLAFQDFMDMDEPTGALVYAKLKYMEHQKYIEKWEKEQLTRQESHEYYDDDDEIEDRIYVCKTKTPYS